MVDGHGTAKYVTGRLIASSADRNWPSLLAERWSHGCGSLPQLTPRDTEIGVLLKGQCRVERAGGGMRQDTRGTPGTTWLCPSGIREEYIYLHTPLDDILHLYVPAEPFSRTLLEDLNIDSRNLTVRYDAVDYDPFIDFIAKRVLHEMNFATSSGSLLIETLSAALSAHLVHKYSETGVRVPKTTDQRGLDRSRLSRVIDFVEANITRSLNVADMARVACLSPAHFARGFRAATGQTPHEFVSERRLALAKQMLLDGRSISEISSAAGFSSKANFARAFRRATHMTAGEFRANNVS